ADGVLRANAEKVWELLCQLRAAQERMHQEGSVFGAQRS
ncbi:hypothetical protein A2U01_0106977, partial [Trifolium medium]|nr:hypothetical protein [Trifolium medium]